MRQSVYRKQRVITSLLRVLSLNRRDDQTGDPQAGQALIGGRVSAPGNVLGRRKDESHQKKESKISKSKATKWLEINKTIRKKQRKQSHPKAKPAGSHVR
jgi:hypothetical protein